MQEIIIWIFERIADITLFALNFKIYGELSLLHFVLGFNLLIFFLSVITFGFKSLHFDIDSELRNAENQLDREIYKKNLREKQKGFVYTYNPKTGEYRKRGKCE